MSISRNEQCPCGSGRKFKKCCGAIKTRPAQASSGRRTRALDEAAFLRLMTRVDDDLREEDFVIPDRPNEAMRRVGALLGCELKMPAIERDPADGVYTGADLAIRLMRWYEEHYKGALEPGTKIHTEEEFLALMEDVDATLRRQEMPIQGRPIAAMGELCRRMNAEFSMMVPEREPRAGVYSGTDLVIRVKRWYDDRYGTRLHIIATVGEVVCVIRGDPWKLELPLVYGGGPGIRFFCQYGVATTLPSEPRAVPRGTPLTPSYFNILDAAVELPDGLAKSLSADERKQMLEAFMAGWNAHYALREIRSIGMVEEVRSDLAAAVTHLMAHPPHPGQAKWSALQASEKMLKTYVSERGGSFGFTHKLADLDQAAQAVGLPSMNPAWVADTQCPAGVRYGDVPVTLEEAVTAHQAALRIVGHIAKELK
jgi:hypothetical protein